MNLDPYGNQMNYEWVMFRASIHDLVPGETFTITLGRSLKEFSIFSYFLKKIYMRNKVIV